MRILAIESSCDDTAAAVCEGRTVLSSAVNSQIERHVEFGGVVPEIASRCHTENICGVVNKALCDANVTIEDIDAVAVTYAPGLIGALLVGVNYAKGLSLALSKPLIPVHHLRSHIAANYITAPDLEPPFLCLVVSGGHTHLVEVKDYTDFSVIGHTRDDAAGECFDKTARAMGFPYPGGVHLDKYAEQNGDPFAFNFTKPHLDTPFDFSFSGIKTSVINTLHHAEQKGEEINVGDLAASVRRVVCEILVEKTIAAANSLGYKKLALAGGVSANALLRREMTRAATENGISLYLPDLKYCGDNAAMVGVQAHYEALSGNFADMNLNAAATMPIDKLR